MMKLLRKLMIDCETSAHYCDKLQYDEASTKERLYYKMHVFTCKMCKSHSDRNTKLSQACNSANLSTMPKDAKAILRARMEQETAQ